MALRKALSNFSGFLLFVFSVLTLICGIGFVVFGVLLENPPKAAVPVCMVVFGSVMLLYSLFGFVSACYPKRGCLICYIVWGVVLAVIQLALVLVCIINPDKVVNTIVQECDGVDDCNGATQDPQKVHNFVYTGRWVFLGWVCATYAILILAAMMACCCNRQQLSSKYKTTDKEADVEAARDRLRQIQMQSVAGQPPAPTKAPSGRFSFGRSKKDTPLMASQEYKQNTASIAQKYNVGAKSELPKSDMQTGLTGPGAYAPPVPPAPMASPPPAPGAWGSGKSSKSGAWK